jgi:hypothetical protein
MADVWLQIDHWSSVFLRYNLGSTKNLDDTTAKLEGASNNLAGSCRKDQKGNFVSD